MASVECMRLRSQIHSTSSVRIECISAVGFYLFDVYAPHSTLTRSYRMPPYELRILDSADAMNYIL